MCRCTRVATPVLSWLQSLKKNLLNTSAEKQQPDSLLERFRENRSASTPQIPQHCTASFSALSPLNPQGCSRLRHRDGFDNPLLVAVTAACDYPQTVGFIHGQPLSHNGGRFSDSEGMKAPTMQPGFSGPNTWRFIGSYK